MTLKLKRLLKDLTIVDFTLLIVGLLLCGFLFLFLQRKNEYLYVRMISTPQEWEEQAFPPEYWEINSISEGDATYNALGRKEAEVVELITDDWGGRRQRVELKLKLSTNFDKRTATHLFDNKPLIIGQPFELIIGNTLFKGTVTNIGKSLDAIDIHADREAIVKVKFMKLFPWHAEASTTMKVTNSKGDTLLTVEDYLIEPSAKVVVTDNGEVLKRADPTKKDVTLTFHLKKVNCEGEVCYYNDFFPLKVGSYFWAHANSTFVSEGSIISVTLL